MRFLDLDGYEKNFICTASVLSFTAALDLVHSTIQLHVSRFPITARVILLSKGLSIEIYIFTYQIKLASNIDVFVMLHTHTSLHASSPEGDVLD